MKLLLPAYAFLFGANIALYLIYPPATVEAIECPWIRLGAALAIIGAGSLVMFFIALLACVAIKSAWKGR